MKLNDPSKTIASGETLFPLGDFRSEAELAPLHAIGIDGHEMPQPYRDLLVHKRDMTGTLEAYHGQSLLLKILNASLDGDILHRQVLLVGEDDNSIIEYGAIRIHLSALEGEPRQLVEQGHKPLGGILTRFKVEHASHPKGYFRMDADETLAKLLGAQTGHTLYGRRNVISGGGDAIIAEVVEILPPLSDASTG